MALLHIALQDGFQGDTVQVRVNGRDVAHKENVTTRTQISFADSFETNVPEGLAEIEVLVPTKHLSEKFSLPVSRAVYLAVSVDRGEVIYRVSEEPFGYA